MEIIVIDRKIETKDIVDIYEIEKYKTMFMNREAGFVVEMYDGEELRFGERIPYESYQREIKEYKDKWKELQERVEEYWKRDKMDIPLLKIRE